MRSATLLSAGSWAVALLVGFFVWLSPDAGIYPAPGTAAVVVGLAFLLWIAGAVMTGFPRSAPRLSFGAELGAVAPVLGAALALILAGHGLLPHPALPMLCIALAGGSATWWARRSNGGPASRGQEFGLTLLLLVVPFVVVPALALAIYGQEIWVIATPDYGTIVDRYEAAGALAPDRPAARAGISAEAAGVALLAIANTGDVRRDTLLMETPGSLSRPWLADSGPFHWQTGDSVMRRALAGLTPGEHAWLVTAAGHPGTALIDTVAYATRLDPWAGLKLPLPASLNAYALPVPNVMPLRNAGRLQLYRAALAAADRKPAVAESLARNALGFGLRLRDDADQLIVAAVGSAIAREAGATLAVLLNAHGRTPAGDSLAVRSAPRPPLPHADGELPTRPIDIRRRLIASVLARSAPRPVLWDIAGALGVSRCTNLRELFYGSSAQLAAAYASLRGDVGPSAHAQAALAVMERGITLESEGSIPPLLRVTDLALGRRVVGTCMATVRVM